MIRYNRNPSYCIKQFKHQCPIKRGVKTKAFCTRKYRLHSLPKALQCQAITLKAQTCLTNDVLPYIHN